MTDALLEKILWELKWICGALFFVVAVLLAHLIKRDKK